MVQLPNVELLKQTHTFPGFYTFKVIGRVTPGFVAKIVSLVREELMLEEDPRFYFRETPAGKYISVTVEPRIEQAEQILAIYSRLSQTDQVMMLL